MRTTPRTWYITGASRGLGRALTVAALEQGDHVIATARTPSALDDLAAQYPKALRIAQVDVTDRDSIRASLLSANDSGGIDLVVNNAGYANLSAIEDTDPDDFRHQVETSFFGTVNVTQLLLPLLRARRSGHIINISSVGARVGNPGLGAYQAAKWAVSGFSQVLAAELAPLGIKVTVVEPGGMRTDWAGPSMRIAPVSAAYQDTVGVLANLFNDRSMIPAGDPDRVAEAILQLAEMSDPPVRLLLGSDALLTAQTAAATLADNDRAWEALSRSTDSDEASANQIDPLRINERSNHEH